MKNRLAEIISLTQERRINNNHIIKACKIISLYNTKTLLLKNKIDCDTCQKCQGYQSCSKLYKGQIIEFKKISSGELRQNLKPCILNPIIEYKRNWNDLPKWIDKEYSSKQKILNDFKNIYNLLNSQISFNNQYKNGCFFFAMQSITGKLDNKIIKNFKMFNIKTVLKLFVILARYYDKTIKEINGYDIFLWSQKTNFSNNSPSDILASLQNYDILIISEFGSSPLKFEFAMGYLLSLLNYRWRAKKTTIICSSIFPKEFGYLFKNKGETAQQSNNWSSQFGQDFKKYFKEQMFLHTF